MLERYVRNFTLDFVFNFLMHYCGVLPLPLVLLILSLTAPPKSTRRSCKQWLPFGPHAAVVRTMNGRTNMPISIRALSNNRCREDFPSAAKSVNKRFSSLCLMYLSQAIGAVAVPAQTCMDHEMEAL